MFRADTWVVILAVFLAVSVAANVFLYYRWHAYRAKPAGTHSHTGMMPRVDRDQILRDLKRKNSNLDDMEEDYE